MTLKEKFEEKAFCMCEDMTQIDNYVNIAEDFAIKFHKWMRLNDTQENAEKWFHYTDKDMLNAFKEEKGL